MEKYDIYSDIGKRTGGDIYVGVVGPVRVGKSTFVKRFAELLMMPNIAGKNKKKIATDELPQSGAGKTVTTTEPKFIPGEAVKVTFGGKPPRKCDLSTALALWLTGRSVTKRTATREWCKPLGRKSLSRLKRRRK